MSVKTLGSYPLPARHHEVALTRHHARPALGEHRQARQVRRRHVLVFRRDDRRLLQALVPVAPGESQERATARKHRRGRGRRLSGLSPLQPGRHLHRRGERRHRHEGLPAHRRRGRAALADATGRVGRAQPALLPPPLQEGHGPDAEGLRGGTPLGTTAPGAGNGGDGHRGVSRGGLRLERALLRGFDRHARHEPDPLPVGWRPGGPDLRCRPVLARRHPRRVERQGRRARSCWATIPSAGARSRRPVSTGAAGRRRRGVRAAGGPGGRAGRGACARARPAARRARHGVPAACLAGAARDPGGSHGNLLEHRAKDRRAAVRARRRRSLRGQRPSRWRSRATASCGTTAASRAIDGAWSASAS